jgi:purine-cytosine permease-like protein
MCLGWSSLNVIVGGQLLHRVDPHIPASVGIILLAICTLVISLFGYHVVHNYEMVAWIPCFVVFLVVLGEFGRHGHFENYVGERKAGPMLSFAASVFGFANSWAIYATDYTYYQGPRVSRLRIAFYSFWGLFLPLGFTQIVGLVISTATVHDRLSADAFQHGGVSGLLHQILSPSTGRFGQFGLAVLALSLIAPTSMALYSLSFSLQTLGQYTRRIPRPAWTFVGTVVYCAVAIPARQHFEAVLENFMLTIGYWLAIYEGVAFPEHFWFRAGLAGYHIEDYDRPTKLPPGFAAAGALCFGVSGAVLGMAQAWFVGPVGRSMGRGGDVGFILAFLVTTVVYIVLRTVEFKYYQR